MNKKSKMLLYIAGFALLILAATLSYNYLSKKYRAPGLGNTATLAATSAAASPDESKGAPAKTPDETDEDEGKVKAPDFTVIDYDGNEATLNDFIGTPIVLNFWASWCPPCRDEMPHFNKVSEEYREDELLFLMVDLVDGSTETVETGKRYIEGNGFTFKVLFDTKQDAAITYGIRSIPCTFFIDRDGYIIGGARGSIDEDTLRYGISLIID